MERGIQIGDVVRLYGYTGTFIAREAPAPFGLMVERDGRVLFGALSASVVEINGRPVPMLSCPIAPPAADYPHEPRFDYVDGPEGNAVQAIDAWYRLRSGEKRVMGGVGRADRQRWQGRGRQVCCRSNGRRR